MYDFHVHSCFSGDCGYNMEDMIKGAIRNGARTVAFTDHIDFEYGDPKVNFVFDVRDYQKDFIKLKNKYEDQIELLLGAEIGSQPHLQEKNRAFVSSCNFDFIIMSTHLVQGSDLHLGEFFKEKEILEAYENYYKEVLSNLESFDDFDVVGHINLIDRYSRYMDSTIELKDYKEVLVQVLEKIISMGKGIELNTSGMRYGINSFLPNTEILKLYKGLGGEIITIGSDAHNPKDVCANFEDAIKLLKELGYNYITTFKERKIKFVKI